MLGATYQFPSSLRTRTMPGCTPTETSSGKAHVAVNLSAVLPPTVRNAVAPVGKPCSSCTAKPTLPVFSSVSCKRMRKPRFVSAIPLVVTPSTLLLRYPPVTTRTSKVSDTPIRATNGVELSWNAATRSRDTPSLNSSWVLPLPMTSVSASAAVATCAPVTVISATANCAANVSDVLLRVISYSKELKKFKKFKKLQNTNINLCKINTTAKANSTIKTR